MRSRYFLPVALCFFAVCTPFISNAQSWNLNNNAANEIILSEGMVTLEQANAWSGKGGMSNFVSMPSSFTGAAFLTYRHSFTRKLSLGITVGLDDCSGQLSYGPPRGYFGTDGQSGNYYTRTYTIAIEPKLDYIKKGYFTFYGYCGLGVTHFENKFTFLPNITDPGFFYGQQGSLVPSNPYDYHATYFNAQVTPVGLQFGQDVAGFFEFGFGYKGLINAGLSVRF